MDLADAPGPFSLLPGFGCAIEGRSGAVRLPLGAKLSHRLDAPAVEASPHSREQGAPTFELPKLCGVSD